EIKEKSAGKEIAVDLGIIRPIYTNLGKTFGNGRYIKNKKLIFQKQRSKQQSENKKISIKQSRWIKDYNHKLSKQLIDYCLSENIDVLILEDLKGHNLSNRKYRKYRKYSWSFKQLLNFISYKAESQGIKVISVNPAYSSQRCSKCGSRSKEYRKSQSLFECDCGCRINADYNAAINLLSFSRYQRLPVNLAIDAA
ncbi:unnamed protein product, partial [marine sediment metagenome]